MICRRITTKKKSYKSKKAIQKKRETMFIGVLAVLLAVALILGVVDLFNGDQGSGYTVTADGHVHAADGTHIGTVEELFGEGAVVTEDGHVHTDAGDHIGSLDDITAADHDHDHAEEEADAADSEEAAEEAAEEEAAAE